MAVTNKKHQSSSALWQPHHPEKTQLFHFMKDIERACGVSFSGYKDFNEWAVANPEEFWSRAWDFCSVAGDKGGKVIEEIDQVPWARFFPHSKISYAENVLRHAGKRPDAPAIIARHQDGPDRVLSWQDLYDQVSLWVQALENAGIGEGDRVAVYLPNIPETVIVMLAASYLGAAFVSAGMEMGGDDLVSRLEQVGPKILITQGGYMYGDKYIDRSAVVRRVAGEIKSLTQIITHNILQNRKPLSPSVRERGGEDIDNIKEGEAKAGQVFQSASDFLKPYKPEKLTFKRRDFNHPLYILFSSGSTGKPKCFEHSAGGVMLKHYSEFALSCDIRPGDRVFYHSTPSWMMWNWLTGVLTTGAMILMYDGSPSYPDPYVQWRFTADHGCTHHGTAAPVILGWAQGELAPGKECDLSPLRMILSTGAVLPPQGFEYIHAHVKQDVNISSISGGTDIVGCFVGGNPIEPTYAGQIKGAMPGMDIRIWDEDGNNVPPGEPGEMVCANAFPSMPMRFLKDEDGAHYREEYFSHYPGRRVWRHGDTIERTAEGQFIIHGRSDATLKQNGVRIGTGSIYRQLEPFGDQIKEAAAVDFTRPDNRQPVIVLFLALESGADTVPEDLQAAIRKAVKNNVGPYSIPTEILAAPGILKTPNGKIAEVVMKKIINDREIKNASLYGEALVKFFEETGRTLSQKYGESE